VAVDEAQCLPDALAAGGVSAVPLVPTAGELERGTRVARIVTHGEQVAADAADDARASRRPGVCPAHRSGALVGRRRGARRRAAWHAGMAGHGRVAARGPSARGSLVAVVGSADERGGPATAFRPSQPARPRGARPARPEAAPVASPHRQ